MKGYSDHLAARGLSDNTVQSYTFAVEQLLARAGDRPADEALLEHKDWLAANYSPKSANLRIAAVNSYLDYISHPGIRLKGMRVQQKSYLDNVISQADYERLRDSLLDDGDTFWYFLVRFLACTGARVSEARAFTVESVLAGHLDVLSKGNKVRRVYIPAALQRDARRWIRERGIEEGHIFAVRGDKPITARGIAKGLKRAANRYGIDPDVVYPHSFRHLFAKNFIRANPDIALLADLMGHESIETTRIYLRRTADEQRAAVDEAVDW